MTIQLQPMSAQTATAFQDYHSGPTRTRDARQAALEGRVIASTPLNAMVIGCGAAAVERTVACGFQHAGV
jgi:hypothetical protein